MSDTCDAAIQCDVTSTADNSAGFVIHSPSVSVADAPSDSSAELAESPIQRNTQDQVNVVTAEVEGESSGDSDSENSTDNEDECIDTPLQKSTKKTKRETKNFWHNHQADTAPDSTPSHNSSKIYNKPCDLLIVGN